jgi:hypothetical protein
VLFYLGEISSDCFGMRFDRPQGKQKELRKVSIKLIDYCFIFAKLESSDRLVTRVNLTNVLDEGLRIGGVGRRMNSKVKSVKQGVYRK